MRLRPLLLPLLLAVGAALYFVWVSVGARQFETAARRKTRGALKPEPQRVVERVERHRPEAAPAPRGSMVLGAGWKTEVGQELAEFRGWTERYLAAPAAERAGILAEGVARARARRPVLAEMIRQDPERALAAAVPVMVRKQLPPEVLSELEERVSATGELALRGVTARADTPLEETTYRVASIDGRELKAYTYGRRAQAGTIENASIHGIVLDKAIAVADSPVRVLEPGEPPDGRPVQEVCAISGIRTPVSAQSPLNLPTANPAQQAVAVEVGGEIHVLCQAAHLKLYAEKIVQGELSNEEQYAADNGLGSSTVTGRPTAAWTHGAKRLLVILVDFPDLLGTPKNYFDQSSISAAYVENVINGAGGVREFYEKNSYGQASFNFASATDVTPVLHLTRNASDYAYYGANTELHADARTLAANAHFDVDSYDRVGVVFSDLSRFAGSQITYAGLANVIGHHFWINAEFDLRVVAHEVGHNTGLNHANLWKVTDGNPVSASGTSTEYGDIYDIMGSGSGPEDHFSHWNKSLLQWIPDSAVTTVTTAGTYRVYKFDDAGASIANKLALKIVRDSTHDYWVGYRRATGVPAFDNGAYVLWGYNDNRQGNLLDLNTPNSGLSDSALPVGGATFNDSSAGITMTATARGGSGSNEYIDVQVGFLPHLSFSDSVYVADEKSGTASVTVTRGGNSAGAVSVQYATVSGSAVAGTDFTATSGTLSWASGDTTPQTITIPITKDVVAESTEEFTVALSNPTGGAVADASPAKVRIVDAGYADTTYVGDFTDSTVKQVMVLPDGRIVACGYFGSVYSSGYIPFSRGGICRYSSSGAVDPSFASGGGVSGGSTNASGDDQTGVYAMARQPDGKIVIGGDFSKIEGSTRLNIARLNADGSLDPTFDPGTGANQAVQAVLVLPNGKIVIGGRFTTYNGTARRCIARLNADGTLDANYNGGNVFSPTQAGATVYSLAMQPDGKVVAGGLFYFGAGTNSHSGVARLTNTGALDPLFTGLTNGAHQSGLTSTLMAVNAVAIQTIGTTNYILIAGQFTGYNGSAKSHIARLYTVTTGSFGPGALDPAFIASADDDISTMLVQPDGNILVGGLFTTLSGGTSGHFGRLLSATGNRDSSFGPTSGHDGEINSFALQADGRVVFGGDYGYFQDPTHQSQPGPIWRFVPGIASPPSSIQFSTSTASGAEGTNVTITATRTGGSATTAVAVGYDIAHGTTAAADFTGATAGTLSWAASDVAPKTITLAIKSDAVPENAETFTVNLGQPLQSAVLLGPAQQAAVTIFDAGFGTWESGKFSNSEMLQPALSGDTADPDVDGLSNLLEYAFGLEPKSPSPASARPQLGKTNVSGTDYLSLTFRRQISAPDLTYTVKSAAAANGPWANGPLQVGSAVPNGDGTESATFRDTVPITGGGQRFLHLEVGRQ